MSQTSEELRARANALEVEVKRLRRLADAADRAAEREARAPKLDWRLERSLSK